MTKLKFTFCIGIFLFAIPLSLTPAFAGCTTCVFYPDNAYCTGGNIAELCQANSEGCTFSGSRDCGGSGCFLAGTPVITDHGLISIEALAPGDQVLTMSASGVQAWTTVERKFKALRTGFFTINGTLNVTGDHPFFISNKWKTVESLSIGDELTSPTGEAVTISSIEWVDEGVRVFNIDVLAPDAFYAGGYLVHNKGPNISQ